MKKLLLFASAVLMTISASAQNVDEIVSDCQAEVATANYNLGIEEGQEQVSGPMRTKANGVYYTLPTGMIYRGSYYVNTDTNEPVCWTSFANMAMYVAPFHTYHFENMCTNRTVATWWVNTTNYSDKYPELIDDNNSLNYNFGNPSLTGSKAIPTISVAGGEGGDDVQWKWGSYKDDDAETALTKTSYIYVRPDIIALSFTPTQMYSHTAGWTNSDAATKTERPTLYGHGTGATYSLSNDNNVYVAVTARQYFPAPATPLYFEAIRANVLSYSDTPIPEGKKLYATIYKAQLKEGKTDLATVSNYEKVGEPIAVFTADNNSLVATKASSKNYKTSYIDFVAEKPVVVDGIFCVEISGFDEEGVDIGFQQFNALTKPDFPRTQVDCRVQGAETNAIVKRIGASRGIHIEFVGMLDAAKVYTEGSYYTDDTKTETEMRYELNKFKIADDGTKILSNGTLSYARVYTAANWASDNYYLADENGEMPEWITEVKADNGTWSSNYYSKVTFKAEPLPEGVTYRETKLYVKSDKGALSADPIILYQGDPNAGPATAIESVTTVENTGKIYNVMGQEVNRAQHGIFIKNGKKFMVK